MKCYGQIRTGNWVQEWYETASRDAGKRAREVRRLGYRALVESGMPQVTGVGVVRMTMVTIIGEGSLPPVTIERL